MKYIVSLLLVIVIISVLVGCKQKEKITRYGDGNLVIEYISEPQEMMNSKYIVRLYDNKELEYGHEYDDELKKITVNDEAYDEIINYAFSSKITSLEGKSISDPNVLDGYWKYVTIYNEDGTDIRIGGSNPRNKDFSTLIGMLNDLIK